MRHAIYYNNAVSGRNDGAPLYYFNVLKNKLKFDITHLLPVGNTRKGFGNFDYHWWIDWGEDALESAGLVDNSWRIPDDGGKTIYVASDTHLGKEYRFKTAWRFDYVFFNQRRAVEEYIDIGEHNNNKIIDWIPHAFEPQAYYPHEMIKRWDIGFVGHLQNNQVGNGIGVTRVEALDRMFKEFPNFYFGSRSPVDPGWNLFESAAEKFAQSKIVFNISIGDDINMRVFEVLGTKSFLLTNYVPTLPELFEDKKHLVMYKSMDEAVELAKYYLEHDEEREKIANAGYEEVIAKHTYQHRIEKILKLINYK